MPEPLKILMLEDRPDDARTVSRLLKKNGLNFTFVVAECEEQYREALDEFHPDLVLSDNSLPQCNATGALAILRQRSPDIPFILVSGTASEEFAASIIKAGADDYLLKGRMARLPSIIKTALKQRMAGKEKREAGRELASNEEKLQSAHLRLLFHIENAPLGFIEWDKDLRPTSWSKRAQDIFGWTEKEMVAGQVDWLKQVFTDDLPRLSKMAEELVSGKVERNTVQHRNCTRDGRVIWCEWFNSVLKDRQGKVMAIMSLVRDITAAKLEEQQDEFDRNNLSALINNTGDLMWSVDGDLNLITFNDAFNRVIEADTGKPLAKGQFILGDQFTPAQQLRYRDYYRRALGGETFTVEDHLEWPLELWSEISFYPIRKDNLVVGTACFSRDVSERRKSEMAMRAIEKEMADQKIREHKEMARAILNAQEKERNHIGQELHDNVNQILVSTRMYLEMAGKDSAAMREQIKRPIELIDTTIREIRALTNKHVTPVKNVDLRELIRSMLEKLTANSAIKTKLNYTVNDRAMSDDLKLNVYRILQEQMNNIVKYAAAANVSVSVKEDDGHIRIAIADDGKGFDTRAKRNGIGISNIMNRIASFNGTMKIKSTPGNGCTLLVEIPYTY